MTNANKHASLEQTTSDIFDGEVGHSIEMLNGLEHDKFVRYALIGDAMRAENEKSICIDITAQVAAALESEPTYNMSHNEQASDIRAEAVNDDVKSNVISLARYKKPLAQFAIAASVCLVALVGVNNNTTQSELNNTLPSLQTMPLTGSVSPVSLSTEQPAIENAAQGLRELQQQRIGALVLEHQRQSRMAYALQQAKQLEEQKKASDVTEEQN